MPSSQTPLPEPRSGKVVVIVVLLAAIALIVTAKLTTDYIRTSPDPATLYPEPPAPLPASSQPVPAKKP